MNVTAEDQETTSATSALSASEGHDSTEGESPDILRLTDPIEAGDRQLGDLLQSLELVEPDSLRTLLVQARRQRQSLRQVLLASGSITLYQLALIEAGNVDGLVLGPVRVLDRLRVTPRETVYHVFDPRRGEEAGRGECCSATWPKRKCRMPCIPTNSGSDSELRPR